MKNRLLSRGMRILLLIAVVLLPVLSRAQTNILMYLGDVNANPTTNRVVTVQALSPVVGNLTFLTSDTNGVILTTLNINTLYNVQVKAPPAAINLQVYLPAGSTGCLDWSNYWSLGGNTIATYPSGATAPSIAMADARYAFNGSTLSNNFYPLSNPSNYFSGQQVTNAINAIAQTNLISLVTITNIAYQQATNQGSADTNFSLSVSNGLAANILLASNTLAAQFITSSNALQASIISSNATQTTAIGVASNSLVWSKQPASGVLTNLALTGAVTNWSITGTNIFSNTNVGGFIVWNVPWQVNLTNHMLDTYGTTNYNNTLYDTNGAALAAAAQVTNGIFTKFQPASQTLTNLANTGAQTNALAWGQNTTLSTNMSGGAISVNATNQTFLTNGLAVWSTVVPTSYLQTNVLPSLTNGFILGSVATNSFDAIGTAGTVGANNTNFTIATATSLTNNLNSASNSITTAYIATNYNNLVTTTNYVGQATLNMVTNLDINNLTFYGNLDVSPLPYTQGFLGMLAAFNAIWLGDAGGQHNHTYVYVNDSNSKLTLSATNGTTVLGNLTVSGVMAGNGGSITNVSVSSNNIVGQINIGQVYGAAGTNGFIASTNGVAYGLGIADHLMFGAGTNFALGTNWIKVGQCGTVGAKGTYFQIANGVWTNVSYTGFNGFSIVYSGGSYSLLSGSQTIYYSSAVNGTWTASIFGSYPSPFVSYAPDYRDAILPGYVTSTNLTAQMIAVAQQYGVGAASANTNLSNISSAGSNVIASIAPVAQVPSLSGVVQGLTNSTEFSATGTNAIQSLIPIPSLSGVVIGLTNQTLFTSEGTNIINYLAALQSVGTNNGVGTNYVIAYVASATNTIPLGGVLTNLNTTASFSSNGLAVITNIASGFGGSGGGGGANTNLSNISSAGSNVIFNWNTPVNANFQPLNNIFQIGSSNAQVNGYGLFVGGITNEMFNNVLPYSSEILGGYNDFLGNSSGGGIIGGLNNTITANGGLPSVNSYIFGGTSNVISGQYSSGHVDYAMILNGWNVWNGRAGATAIADRGWSDANETPGSQTNFFVLQQPDMLAIREVNGVAINTNSAGGYALNVNGTANITALYINGNEITNYISGVNPSIASLNGYGTNLTLAGVSYLNSSNLSVMTNQYVSFSAAGVGNSGPLIPPMTSQFSPYGYASASAALTNGQVTAFNAFNPATNYTFGYQVNGGSAPVNYLIYQFPVSMVVTSMSYSFGNAFNSGDIGLSMTNYLIGYNVNNNPTVLSSNRYVPSSIVAVTNNFPAFYGSKFELLSVSQFLGGTSSFTNVQYVSNFQLYGPSNATSVFAANVISNSPNSSLEIISTSTNGGVSINTANPSGYALNVNGGVNVSDNFYVNQAPISGPNASVTFASVTAQDMGSPGNMDASSYSLNGAPLNFSSFTQTLNGLYVTNGVQNTTNINGLYALDGVTGYWTNSTTTAVIIHGGYNPYTGYYYEILTNISNPNPATVPYYSKSGGNSPIGIYGPWQPQQFPNLTPSVPAVVTGVFGSTNTFLIGGPGGGYDGSLVTNLPYFKTVTISGGSASSSVNSDGSSNLSLTISGGGSSTQPTNTFTGTSVTVTPSAIPGGTNYDLEVGPSVVTNRASNLTLYGLLNGITISNVQQVLYATNFSIVNLYNGIGSTNYLFSYLTNDIGLGYRVMVFTNVMNTSDSIASNSYNDGNWYEYEGGYVAGTLKYGSIGPNPPLGPWDDLGGGGPPPTGYWGQITVTNYIPVLLSSNAIPSYYGNAMTVDPVNGNDAAAVPGSVPSKTISRAVYLTGTNGVIFVRPGHYQEEVILQPGQSIYGSGIGVTVMDFGVLNEEGALLLSYSNVVANITIASQLNTGAATWGDYIYNVDAGTGTPTVGSGDGLYADYMTNCVFDNCHFHSDWDSGAFWLGFTNCTWNSCTFISGAAGLVGTAGTAHGIIMTGGCWGTFNNCVAACYNATNSSLEVGALVVQTPATGTVNFNNMTLQVGSTNTMYPVPAIVNGGSVNFVGTFTSNNVPFTVGVAYNGNGSGVTNVGVANLSSGGISTSNEWVGRFIGNLANATNLPVTGLNINANGHVPVAVTVGASPFTFSNTTPNILECYFSGSVAYSVSKNGVGVYGSLVGDDYFQLQPTNKCVITYTVSPTMYTNAW